MPSVSANGASIYYELRGSGPPVLFIAGAMGDAGYFDQVADLLADEFTVLTYDRRGNSRSPKPEGWERTSVEEQAADAAALLRALDLAPAAIFGNSYGGSFALGLVVDSPDVVRGAIVHDPPLISVLERPEETGVEAVVEDAMRTGGPRAAADQFLRFFCGDAAVDGLEPPLRERLFANAETLFGSEMGNFENYRPDDATLAAITVPTRVLASEESPPFLRETSAWLAERTGTELMRTPGSHTPQLDRPQELVQTIRPLLREFS
jgi:pimeloyl-ACP methyl ester carboxylesterase